MAETKPPTIQLSGEHRARLSTLHTTTHAHLESIANIIAESLQLKSREATTITFTMTHKSRVSYKCCAHYSDGSCGCVEDPPGISRVCGPGE
jgi:hypothetical protein